MWLRLLLSLSDDAVLLAISSLEDARVGTRRSTKKRPLPLKPGPTPGSSPSIVLGKVLIVAF
jgi:hypothetical protein